MEKFYQNPNSQKKNKNRQNLEKKTAVVWVYCTYNNTLLTLTDSFGSTLAWSSSGACGFKNSRKSTTHAAETAALSLSEKIYQKGYKHIHIKTKGVGRGKKKVIFAFLRSGLVLEKITEYYSIPFNGTRQKRKRRT